ncbi:MAG: xylulokinase [Candidatus Brockarchaeota archaeon]|nr:xylulokinase [Candidatus Brockarchaeota archaeon]
MSKDTCFIGVDVGTQSMKTLIVDGESGSVIGKSVENYGLVEGLPPGHKEQDPKVWIDAFRKTVKEAISKSGVDPRSIKAIGVSGQQHGFVPLDENGNVIRPAKLWNDTSTAKECEYLTRKLGGVEKVIKLIGNPFLPGYTAPKILWLKRNEPKNYSRLKHVLLPHDYLNYYLTGNMVMEYGDASGTAIMDVRRRVWCKKVIDAIDPELESKLPPLQGSDKPAGVIRKEVAIEFGFRDDVVVSAGGGDNMMGAIGTGNVRKGIVTASFGTSGTIYAYSESPVIDPKGEIAAFCDSTNAWLPLLCTMNVTVATEYVRELFNMTHDDLAKAVEEAPVGANGLLLIPYFEGERTPNVPDGTGVFYGLNSRTFNKQNIARSAMEGVTLGMNYGLNRMRELGIKPKEIRLTGGGSKNRAWRQIAADIFNAEVVCIKVDEGAAYGAALQAMWCYLNYTGSKTSIGEICDRFVQLDENTRASPKSSNVEIYKELQELHNMVSKSLRKSFKTHRSYLDKHVT